MITRKMMALAAVPVAAVLAGGGVAAANAAGTPAGTAVVQQATTHHPGEPCHGHHVTPVTARHDGDHGKCDSDDADHGQAARTGSGVTARTHCLDDHGDE